MPKRIANETKLLKEKPHVTPKDIFRAYLNIFFAVTQIITAFIFVYFGIGTSVAQQSNKFQTPVIPAGYTFSIWGLIFFSSLVYAIYQALPKNLTLNIFRKVGFFTAMSFFGCTLWQIVAQLFTFNFPTVLIISSVLVSSVYSLFKVDKFSLNLKEKVLIKFPIAVLAGWISVATFANISSVLFQLKVFPFGITLTQLSFFIILLACLFSIVIVAKSKNIIYLSTIVWALLGILAANIFINLNEMIVYEIIFLIIGIVIVYLLAKD